MLFTSGLFLFSCFNKKFDIIDMENYLGNVFLNHQSN